jgi:hypothetical protein
MIVSTMGHGRLIKPKTRVGHTGYENDPIGFGGRPESQYICRHDAPNNALVPEEVSAGDKLTVQWVTTAAHVGDCALYMSYDGDKDLEDMRWFKIANKQDCKSFQNQDMQFDLPNWLPGGNAVLRWEWYALHVYPTIEFYAQCTDIVVKPSAQSILPGNIPTFKVFENGQKTTLPLSGNDQPGFRNAFSSNNQNWSPSNPSQFMTGPSCALTLENSSVNDCDLTAPGTTGHVDLDTSGEPGPMPPTPEPTREPVESVTQEPTTPGDAPTMEPTAPGTDPTPTPEPATQPPSAEPATQPPSAEPATQPPSADPSDNGDCSQALFLAYGQCAGDGFAVNNPNGCDLCPAGYQCYQKSNWYSNCNHSCPQGLGWDCEGGDSSVDPAPTPAPADGSCPNAQFDTCGGQYQIIGDGPADWSGETCCQAGLVCEVKNQYYHQCVKPVRRVELLKFGEARN